MQNNIDVIFYIKKKLLWLNWKIEHRKVRLCNLTIVRAEVPGFVVQSQRSLGVASLLAEPVTEKEREKKGFVLIRGDLNRASAEVDSPPHYVGY